MKRRIERWCWLGEGRSEMTAPWRGGGGGVGVVLLGLLTDTEKRETNVWREVGGGVEGREGRVRWQVQPGIFIGQGSSQEPSHPLTTTRRCPDELPYTKKESAWIGFWWASVEERKWAKGRSRP
jgi:hypothetical protein